MESKKIAEDRILQWSKVKTILIVMVAVVNCILLANIGTRYIAEKQVRRDVSENLSQALSQRNIASNKDTFYMNDKQLYFYEMTIDSEIIQEMVKSFFGDDYKVEQFGDIVSLTNSIGDSASLDLNGLISADVSWTGEVPENEQEAYETIKNIAGNYILDKDFDISFDKNENSRKILIKRVIDEHILEDGLQFMFTLDGRLKVKGYSVFGDILPTASSFRPFECVAAAILNFVSENNNIKEIMETTPCYYLTLLNSHSVLNKGGFIVVTDAGTCIIDDKGALVRWIK